MRDFKNMDEHVEFCTKQGMSYDEVQARVQRDEKGVANKPEFLWGSEDSHKASWCKQVKEFSQTASEGAFPTVPTMMLPKEAKFIRKMVNSEFDELDEALHDFWESGKPGNTVKDHVKVADALIDAIYYLMDCAAKHGLDLDPLFQIIQKANMAKFKNGVIKNSEGKVLKPSGWMDPEPELMAEMQKQLKE